MILADRLIIQKKSHLVIVSLYLSIIRTVFLRRRLTDVGYLSLSLSLSLSLFLSLYLSFAEEDASKAPTISYRQGKR